ncbi:MAG TPA: diacylglycerol kinase family protein [Candidatus Limnocylindria bacterium]|nr:diacylglycerol kinase family protein [Candidatus Limnocylindria bacterium]
MAGERAGSRAMIVINPAAGSRGEKRDGGELARCEAILEDAGFALDRFETGAESPSAADLARRAVEQGYAACIVAGGDGTVAPAAAALLDTPVVLGILPFGSVMNIAHGLDLPLEPVKAAEVIARRRVQRADAGEVGGKVFFETAGIGLDAEIFGAARHAERGDWRRVIRRGVRLLTRRSYRVAINVDGREDRQRALQVLVLNSPYYGFSLEILPRVSMTDGLLDVAVFPRMGRLMLVRSFLTVWRGGKLPGKAIAYRGARIEISSDESVAVHADGALAGSLPARFACRAGSLSFFS